MNEDFLHFIFRNRLWEKDFEFTTVNEKIEILDTGHQNNNSGPDFFNSKIKIGDTLWVGNTEIHINSSDWYRHNHNKDLAYGNVILHIVFNHDKEVYLPDGTVIPTWEIKFPHVIYNKFSELKNNEKEIPCSDYLEITEELTRTMWIERMAIERLEHKTEYLSYLSDRTSGNVDEILYISLARSFGFGINAEAFEALAFALPLKILTKYTESIAYTEALLFGQSGLLETTDADEYCIKLNDDYKFLAKKHGLKPLSSVIWKKSRMRPPNFPDVRIAQFASLMQSFTEVKNAITNSDNLINLEKLLNPQVSEYWKSHYTLGKKSENARTKFGKDARDIILINTLAPFVFYYFKNYSTEQIDNEICTWLQTIKSENNKETRLWKELGIISQNAFESQALLNLKKEYCDKIKCINCAIGTEIMRRISEV